MLSSCNCCLERPCSFPSRPSPDSALPTIFLRLRASSKIARATATHAPSLYRVLRLLVSVGVFREGPPRHFALNPAAQLLQSGHSRSLRDMAVMFADPWVLRSYARLDQCLRTGTDGVTLEFGKHVFDLFQDIPDQAANFHRAMTSFSSGS